MGPEITNATGTIPYCSKFVTGDCTKEIMAICDRFYIEFELTEPYMIFSINDSFDVDNGSGEWYTVDGGERLVVSAHDDNIDDPTKTFKMAIRSDNIIDTIKFISNTYKVINFVSADDLITAENMCNDLSLLETFRLNGFNKISNFDRMFYKCHNVTDINAFFVLPETLAGDLFNTMNSMFYECKSMTYVPDLDFSHTTDFTHIFDRMYKVTSIQKINNETEAIADWMFTGTAIRVDVDMDYSLLSTTKGIYSWCRKLEYSYFATFPNSVDVSFAFYNAPALKTTKDINVDTATTADGMFDGCAMLKCINHINTATPNMNFPIVDMFLNDNRLQIPSPSEQELIVVTPGLDFTNTISCPPKKSERTFEMTLDYNYEKAGDDYSYQTIKFIADADIIVDWGNDIYCHSTSIDSETTGETDISEACEMPDYRPYTVIEGHNTFAYKKGEIVEYIGPYPLLEGNDIKVWSFDNLGHIEVLPNNYVTKIVSNNFSNITDMTSFAISNTALDEVTIYDASGVLIMESAFENTPLRKIDLRASKNCTSFHRTFYGCAMLDDWNKFDFTSATDTSYMFYGCTRLGSRIEHIIIVTPVGPVGIDKPTHDIEFKIPVVENVDFMFTDCIAIKSMDFNQTSASITSAESFFDGCLSIIGTSNIRTDMTVNMKAMLRNTPFIELDSLITFTSARNFNETFAHMKLLECIKTRIDTLNATDTTDMFIENPRLFSPSPSDQKALMSAGGFDYIPAECNYNLLESAVAIEYASREGIPFTFIADGDVIVMPESNTVITPDTPYSIYMAGETIILEHTQIGASDVSPEDNLLVPMPPITNYTILVASLSGSAPVTHFATQYNSAVTSVIVHKSDTITSFENTFSENLYLNALDFNSADTSGALNTNYMCAGCVSLPSFDFNQDMPSITTASHMFDRCSILTDIYNLKTENITDMSYMFNGTALNIFNNTGSSNNFRFGQVDNFENAFANMSRLQMFTIDIDTTLATNKTNMFDGSTYLAFPSPTDQDMLTSTSGSLWEFEVDYSLDMGNEDLMIGITKVMGQGTFDVITDGDFVVSYRPLDYTSRKLIVGDYTTHRAGDQVTVSERTGYEIVFASLRGSTVSTQFRILPNVDIGKIFVFNYRNITSLDNAFEGNSHLTNLQFNHYGTPIATSAREMLKDCTSLVSTKIRLENVTDFTGLFEGCTSLIKADFKTAIPSSIVNAGSIFKDCSSMMFTKYGDIFENAIDMSHAFDGSGITSYPIGLGGNIENASYMFANTDIHGDFVVNMPAITDASYMFYSCDLVQNIDMTVKSDLITSYSHTFDGCSSVKRISNLGSSICTNFDYMFAKCPLLMCVSNIDTTAAGATKDNMFDGIYYMKEPTEVDRVNITDIDGLDWQSTGTCSTEAVFHMVVYSPEEPVIDFISPTSITTLYIDEMAPGMWNVYSHDPVTMVKFQDTSDANVLVTKVIVFRTDTLKSTYRMFHTDMESSHSYVMKSLETIIFEPSCDMSNITNFSYMFGHCHIATTIDVSNFDTSSATNLQGMFVDCRLVKNLDVSNFKTSNVTNVSVMFYSCFNLEFLNISAWSHSNILTYQGIFTHCSKLNNIETIMLTIGPKANNVSDMFSFCEQLTAIDIRLWNLAKIDMLQYVFQGCTALEYVKMPLDINVLKLGAPVSGMFKNCSSLKCISEMNTENSSNKYELFMGCSVLTAPDSTEQDALEFGSGAAYTNPNLCPL